MTNIPNPLELFLTPKEAREKLDEEAVLIDLRSDAATSFKQFNVTAIKYLKITDLTEIISLDKNKIYIIADTSTCEKSRVVAKVMLSNGFQNIFTLAGGFVEWEREGLPISINNNARLSGSCAVS